MLTAMRHFVRSPYAVALIAVLVVSFVVWGTGDIFRASRGDAVAIVGPERITIADLSRAWQQEVNYQSRVSKGKFSESEARQQGLPDMLLDRLITQTAFTAKSKQLDMTVSPQMLRKYAEGYKAFQDPITGGFSDEQYQDALRNAQISPREFEDSAREDITRDNILDVVNSGVRAPIKWTNDFLDYQGETRKVQSLFLPFSVVPPVPAPTDEQLQGFYKEHINQFKVPERRSATLVMISAQDLALDIKPDDAELKKQYDFDHSKYVTPETRTWVQIPAQDETQAKAAAARLKAGESAAHIMKSLNIPGDPIHLKDKPKTGAPDDQIGTAVFDAQKGATGATEGRFTWGAWRVDEITPKKDPTFAELKPELEKQYIQEHAKDKLFDLVGNFEGDRSDGLSMVEAAKKENLVTVELPPVDGRGADADLHLVEAYKEHPEILKTLFDLDELVESDVEELPNGDYYALMVDKVIPSTTPAFEDVKDKVTASWKIYNQAQALTEFAKETTKELDNGTTMADLASKYDGARSEITILSRTQSEPSLPKNVVGNVFVIAPGKVVDGPLPGKQELVFTRLLEVIPAQQLPKQTVMMLSGQMDKQVQQDLETEFVTGLRTSYSVKVDQRLKDFAVGANN